MELTQLAQAQDIVPEIDFKGTWAIGYAVYPRV
jgi:hypothetical protein